MNTQSSPELNLRKVDRLGDLPILLSLITGKSYTQLFSKRERHKLFLMLLSKYLKCCTAMSAYSLGAVLRFSHGSQSRGLIMLVFTLSYILIFNSSLVMIIFKPMMIPIVPAMAFFSDSNNILKWIFEDIHSKGLLIYAVIFLAASLVDIILTWFGFGNTDLTKRGNSWIYILISKYSDKINERIVQIIIEPIVLVGLGALAWTLEDKAFAIFLWVSSFSIFIQEALDEAWSVKNRAMI